MAVSPAIGGLRSGGGTKGKKALAWISFFLAIVAGAAFAVGGLGDLLNGLLNMFGVDWLAALVFMIALGSMLVDIIVDRIPNQVAMWMAMVVPALAQSVPGKLSETVQNLYDQILTQVQSGLSAWLGVASTWGIAIVSAVLAFLVGRRVLAKGG